MEQQGNNANKTRHSRFFNINREFLVFVVFLLIALVFWFIQTFKDTTEITLEYKIEVTGLSEKEMKVANIPSTVDLKLQGKGFKLIKMAISTDRIVMIDIKDMDDKTGKHVINQTVWKELMVKTLPDDIKADTKTLPDLAIPCLVQNHFK